jgi:RimJ/RimL family protein N-acetyltransferase
MADSGFTIETPRLLLREFRADDAAPLCALNADHDVMRYTGEDPFPDERAALQFIETYDHYARHGFGRWAVEELGSGNFMGFCGLKSCAESGDVDLAFRLFPDYWASGYATEASQASLAAGFNDFGLNDIIGRAMRENLPSISVLQKLGMSFRQMSEDRGLFWLIYGVSEEGYRQIDSNT